MDIEKLIDDLKLVSSSLTDEMICGKSKGISSIASAYSSLLKLLHPASDNVLSLGNREDLLSQYKKMKCNLAIVESLLNKEINKTNLHCIDNFVEPMENLDGIIHNLKYILDTERRYEVSMKRYENLTKSREKEFKGENNDYFKSVVIIGENRMKLFDKFYELEEEFKGDIVVSNKNSLNHSFKTRYMHVQVHNVSDSLRGNRMDKIYVDEDMSIRNFKVVESMKKNKNTVIIYF